MDPGIIHSLELQLGQQIVRLGVLAIIQSQTRQSFQESHMFSGQGDPCLPLLLGCRSVTRVQQGPAVPVADIRGFRFQRHGPVPEGHGLLGTLVLHGDNHQEQHRFARFALLFQTLPQQRLGLPVVLSLEQDDSGGTGTAFRPGSRIRLGLGPDSQRREQTAGENSKPEPATESRAGWTDGSREVTHV